MSTFELEAGWKCSASSDDELSQSEHHNAERQKSKRKAGFARPSVARVKTLIKRRLGGSDADDAHVQQSSSNSSSSSSDEESLDDDHNSEEEFVPLSTQNKRKRKSGSRKEVIVKKKKKVKGEPSTAASPLHCKKQEKTATAAAKMCGSRWSLAKGNAAFWDQKVYFDNSSTSTAASRAHWDELKALQSQCCSKESTLMMTE